MLVLTSGFKSDAMHMNVEERPLNNIDNFLINIVTKHICFFSKSRPRPHGTHARALRRAIFGIPSTIFTDTKIKMPKNTKKYFRKFQTSAAEWPLILWDGRGRGGGDFIYKE